MSNNNNRKKQHNKGFSLFTVLIAVSFVGILGLLVLYIALSNFNMKVTDLKGKDSFYTAERAIEEIRTGLQQDVGDAMSKAYTQVLETYNKNTKLEDISLDKQRQSDFEDLFIKELVKKLKITVSEGDVTGNENRYSLQYLRNYVDLQIDDSTESLIITNPAGTEPVMKSSKKSGVSLKNLKVIYVDPKGRASIIETDIRLKIPDVQFPTPSTLPDLMNMIVVANQGIVCEGAAGSASTIEGSIYAGLLSDRNGTSILVSPSASLNVSLGDKLVAKGTVDVGVNSTFTTGAGVNFWAKGLNADSVNNVSLTGSTYFADDLTISGKNNNVTLSGSYFGYGSYESAMDNSCRFSPIYRQEGVKTADLSSAISINGKNTTLDLSGLKKLMLAGKNYIASSKVPSGTMKTNTQDIMTGESLTVKGTQLAYLAPTEILGNDNMTTDDRNAMTNPMTFDEYTTYLTGKNLAENGKDQVSVQWDTSVESWNNKTLREIGVNPDEPVKTVFYNNDSGGFVYFYLNFTDSQKASDFMQYFYLNGTKEKMDQYLSFYFGSDGSGINIMDPQAYLRYVTNGNVLSYDSSKQTGNMEVATSAGSPDAKVLQDQIGYQNTWYALNRKMITSCDLLNTEVKEDDEKTHDETDANRSVFDNLVNEKKMVQFIEANVNDGSKEYVYTADENNGGLKAIMYHNGKNSTFTVKENGVDKEVTVSGANQTLNITKNDEEKLRLVVCTGNVKIEDGVHFKGIIMSKGTLTLGNGATLESSPLEAAKVFQAQISSLEDGESAKAQDFFWDGDKYVLGNSSSTSAGTNANISDVYDLADCVVYDRWNKE
ncbi:type IV pilus modification PilV family protein [Blautia sp. HCP3S3_C4]|uniref:type IV pilus modification PilV family protein n=1 Tax=Blautia sp. HCP3S3_C4 TaxID=3438911 RepID=UPI003F896DD9